MSDRIGTMQDPPATPSRRQRVLNFRMDELLEEARLHRQHQLEAIPEARRDLIAKILAKYVRNLQFVANLLKTIFFATIVPAQACIELTIMALIYTLASPHPWHYITYNIAYSFEDILLLSLLRNTLLILAYIWGNGAARQRPYLKAAYCLAPISILLSLWKVDIVTQSHVLPREYWPGLMAVCIVHAVFAVTHVMTGRKMVAWAERRWEVGLPTSAGYEVLEGRGGGGDYYSSSNGGRLLNYNQPMSNYSPRLPPTIIIIINDNNVLTVEELADGDSKWLNSCQCGGGLVIDRVHYKIASPSTHTNATTTSTSEGIVILIHGFGGGVFSWRNIMQPLADACNMSVVAFDRPGFGLTSRPPSPHIDNGGGGGGKQQSSPYSVQSHVALALHVAQRLGMGRVMFVGAGDGALVALMAAAQIVHNLNLQVNVHSLLDIGCVSSQDNNNHHHHAGTGTNDGNSSSGHDGFQQRNKVGTFSESLDAAWIGSLPVRKTYVESLLRGDWPIAIQPITTTSGSSSGIPAFDRISGRENEEYSAAAAADDKNGINVTSKQQGLLGSALKESSTSSTNSGSVLTCTGLVLLHPDLSGKIGPNYIRALHKSSIGRRVCQRLLRSDIPGEMITVVDRRRNNNRGEEEGVVGSVAELYRLPLYLPNWDNALMAVSSSKNGIGELERAQLLKAVKVGGLRTLVVTGDVDGKIPPLSCSKIAASCGGRLVVIGDCGHYSFEEQPRAVVDFMREFIME